MALQNEGHAVNEPFQKSGAPEIMNTDQGSQLAFLDWTDPLKRVGSRISMDGEARYVVDIFIERLWRTAKFECVYPTPWGLDHRAELASGDGSSSTTTSGSMPPMADNHPTSSNST